MTDFSLPEERQLADRFLKDGYIIAQSESAEAVQRMQRCVAELAAGYLGVEAPADAGRFLDGIGGLVTESKLNDFRLHVIDGINQVDWFRRSYFDTARNLLQSIVGNELCMQRRVNLSIQLPKDQSSLLPVHSDTWSGDSPFEVVLWIPLVNCYRSKSMFLLPPGPASIFQDNFKARAGESAEDIFQSIKDDVTWMDVPFGSILLFNQNLPHGNRVNDEPDARWTMNCRFKAVFTPYSDKKLGEFFEPVSLRPATRIGLAYRAPEDFEE